VQHSDDTEGSVGPERDEEYEVTGTPPTLNERLELKNLELTLATQKEATRQQQNQLAFESAMRQADSADRQAQQRIMYGLIAIIGGLVTLAALYIATIFFFSSQGTTPEQGANNVVASMGAVTGVIGSLVSAYFGIQLGSAGRERAESQRDRALAASSEEPPSQ